MDDYSHRRIDRRAFMRSAVAIGGASALAACTQRTDSDPTATTPAFPQGPDTLATLPERQHEWGPCLVRDSHWNTVLPQHHVILLFDYEGSAPPEDEEREQVAGAFRTLERAFQRGTGGDQSAVIHDGLLFVVGYSPGFFERTGAELPDTPKLHTPSELLSTLDEPDATADDYDAVVHLASDHAPVVLAAEEALLGDLERLNGVPVEADLAGVLSVADRRAGFIGKGLPTERLEHDDIPEHAPLSMGFKSGFRDNLPPEDKVTIREGPFAGGTTMQVSKLDLDLDGWYEQPETERVHRMFSTAHSPDEVGATGEPLGDDSGIRKSHVESLDERAATEGCVGHTAKTARARDDDFVPRILRRDFNASTEASSVLVFDSWQRDTSAFVETRRAMNGDDLDVDPHGDGILDAITVRNRATFLMPPRSLRALPHPSS